LLLEFAEIVNVPVIPILMSWSSIANDHSLMAGRWVCIPVTATAMRQCRPSTLSMLRHTDFDDVLIKPVHVYEEMNRFFGRNTRTCPASKAEALED
jgi:glyoxylate carboligase